MKETENHNEYNSDKKYLGIHEKLEKFKYNNKNMSGLDY
jgi:hypothetical protein